MGRQILQAVYLGGREHRADADVSELAAAAPQAHEVDEHARAADGGDQEAHLRGEDLPQCGELLAAGAGADGGDA